MKSITFLVCLIMTTAATIFSRNEFLRHMKSDSNDGDVTSEFKTLFPKTIELGNHEWEVALLEMSYPTNVLSFVGERMEVYGPKRLDFFDAFPEENGTVGEYLEYKKIDGFIILNKVNDHVKAVWTQDSLKAKSDFPVKIIGLEKDISITLDGQYIGEVVMTPKKWTTVYELTKFLNENMYKIAPITFEVLDDITLVTNISNGYSLHFYQDLHTLLGYQYKTLYPGENVASAPVVLYPTLMYIYSDIVNLTYLDNEQKQILHVVPFEKSGKWSADTPTYVPINKSKLSGVGINIRTGFWNTIFPFASLLTKVYMLLHFRKKE